MGLLAGTHDTRIKSPLLYQAELRAREVFLYAGEYKNDLMSMMNEKRAVFVLRVGHHTGRDERASTHLCLAARALGANGIYYSGQKDEGIEESMRKVVERWGGDFFVKYVKEWKGFLKKWKEETGGKVVHLTMYGEEIGGALERIRRFPLVLAVVGGAKMPPEAFSLAEVNVSVGSQPHSEIAALAVFLDRYFEGEWERKGFVGARLRVKPNKNGKSFIDVE